MGGVGLRLPVQGAFGPWSLGLEKRSHPEPDWRRESAEEAGQSAFPVGPGNEETEQKETQHWPFNHRKGAEDAGQLCPALQQPSSQASVSSPDETPGTLRPPIQYRVADTVCPESGATEVVCFWCSDRFVDSAFSISDGVLRFRHPPRSIRLWESSKGPPCTQQKQADSSQVRTGRMGRRETGAGPTSTKQLRLQLLTQRRKRDRQSQHSHRNHARRYQPASPGCQTSLRISSEAVVPVLTTRGIPGKVGGSQKNGRQIALPIATQTRVLTQQNETQQSQQPHSQPAQHGHRDHPCNLGFCADLLNSEVEPGHKLRAVKLVEFRAGIAARKDVGCRPPATLNQKKKPPMSPESRGFQSHSERIPRLLSPAHKLSSGQLSASISVIRLATTAAVSSSCTRQVAQGRAGCCQLRAASVVSGPVSCRTNNAPLLHRTDLGPHGRSEGCDEGECEKRDPDWSFGEVCSKD